MLRVVRDESRPLTKDELQDRGNELSRRLRREMLQAVSLSMPDEVADTSWSPARVRFIEEKTQRAAEAWQRAAATAAEITHEIDKTRRNRADG